MFLFVGSQRSRSVKAQLISDKQDNQYAAGHAKSQSRDVNNRMSLPFPYVPDSDPKIALQHDALPLISALDINIYSNVAGGLHIFYRYITHTEGNRPDRRQRLLPIGS
jgi:hypothetical protein